MRKFIANLEEPLRGIVIFAIGIGLLWLLNFGVAKGKDLYAYRIEQD